MKIDEPSPFQRGANQQPGTGPVRARFVELQLIDHEFLVERRQWNRSLDVAQMVQTSLEKILVGQDRNRRRSRFLISPRHTDRVESLVEFLAEKPQARGGFLDPGNQ